MGAVGKIKQKLGAAFPSLFGWYIRNLGILPRLKRRILRDVRRHPGRYSEPGLAEAVEYITHNGVSIFSYAYAEKYKDIPVGVFEDGGLHYVMHNGHRLYWSAGTPPEKIAGNYRSLLREQDPGSPHYYIKEGFGPDAGCVLFDLGAAEGIFALDHVETATRVFLFEADPQWVEPLRRTFEPWKDKVVIINKFASAVDEGNTVAVDTVAAEYGVEGPVFLKLDVEGAERDVIRGAEKTLASHPGNKAVVCTYHRIDDHTVLSRQMEGMGFAVESSGRYMLFVWDRDVLKKPYFRHGVIYCKKTKTE